MLIFDYSRSSSARTGLRDCVPWSLLLQLFVMCPFFYIITGNLFFFNSVYHYCWGTCLFKLTEISG
ncbi:hypothetical protein M5D96_014232, partial [Drosophila gunungcola]